MSQPNSLPPEPSERGALTATRNKAFAGLVFAVPLLATFAILRWIYLWVQNLSAPLIERGAVSLNRLPWFDGRIPVAPEPFPAWAQALGVLAVVLGVILVLLLIGILITNVVGRRVVGALDDFLLRIPFVSFIYKSLKQAIDAFRDLGAGERKFQRVVYVKYPATGSRLLGFVTGSSYDEKMQKEIIHIFVPTSPNPLTGLLILVEADEVEDSPMSIEDAMKMALSAGIVGPKAF